jgi:hypothetical protein
MSDHHDVEVQLGTEIEELEKKLKLANRYKEDADRSLALMAITIEGLKKENDDLEAGMASVTKMVQVLGDVALCDFCVEANKDMADRFDKVALEHAEKFGTKENPK